MSFIETLGQQMAGQAGGGLLGLALSGINDDRQIAQQQRLNVLNREMMDYQYGKQYDLWKKTGPTGMTEELKRAGLNPALIYGMSGAGGGTTGSGSGGGSQATGHSGEAMGMMLGQAAMTAAQIENIKANTEKTKAETANVAPTGENIKADTALKGAEELLTKAKTEFQRIENDVNRNTISDQIDQIRRQVEKTTQEAKGLNQQNQITAETMEATIRQAKLQAIQTALENTLIKTETELKGKLTEQVKEQIFNLREATKIMIENKSLPWEYLRDKGLERLGADNNEGNPLSGLIGFIAGILGGEKKRTVVEGFKQRY